MFHELAPRDRDTENPLAGRAQDLAIKRKNSTRRRAMISEICAILFLPELARIAAPRFVDGDDMRINCGVPHEE